MTDVAHVVDQLQRAGLRPSERQWEVIRQACYEAIPLLLELATDTTLLAREEPVAYGPVHALRLLGECAPLEPASIDRLLQALPLSEEAEATDAGYIWGEDLAHMIARSGRTAFEVARTRFLDRSAPAEQRAAAAEVTAFSVEMDGDLRSEAIAFLREQLPVESDPYVMGFVVDALANLGAAETYSEVMATFKRGAVDRTVVTAAATRQLLLGGGAPDILKCVRHTLAERYDQHGPFTEEQRRALVDRYLGH